MEHIQKIIDNHLEEILDIIRADLGQINQEPDHVLIKELREYFNR